MINRIKEEILKYFPINLRNAILLFNEVSLDGLREIRVRVNQKIALRFSNKDYFVGKGEKDLIVDKNDINKIFECICSNSLYAFTSEIANGYITIAGGHRVGITGKPLYKDNKIYSIKDISSLNFRIAREIIGISDKVLDKIKIDNEFVSTLIISPPGLGKTTLIRDIARVISNSGHNVGIVDERSEIAASFLGVPQNDIGSRSDVMDSVYKPDGIKMMVRSMNPDFIVTDEIGTDGDAESIMYAVNSGVKIIATAHGSDISDLYKSSKMKEVLNYNIFKKVIFITKDGVCVE